MGSANMRMNKVYKGALKKKVNNNLKDMPINNLPIQHSSMNIHSENIIERQKSNNNNKYNTFEQYGETKHNDCWLKRKHLFQKYYDTLHFQKEESCFDNMIILDKKVSAVLNIINNNSKALSKEKRCSISSDSSSNLAFKKRIKSRKDQEETLVFWAPTLISKNAFAA